MEQKTDSAEFARMAKEKRKQLYRMIGKKTDIPEFVKVVKGLGLNPVLLREIIRMRGLGYNNADIARMSGISRPTVNSYIRRLRRENPQTVLRINLLAFRICSSGI